jgi:hypothetical protein
MLLELADWAYRKLTYLNTDAHKHSADTAKGEAHAAGQNRLVQVVAMSAAHALTQGPMSEG